MPDSADLGLLPEEFVLRMRGLLGAEADTFFAALTRPAAGLRVNTLRLTPERFEELSPFEISRLPFPEEGFALAPGQRPGRHPYHAAGLYYLQDPGAMAVGALVDPQPGECILDLAAAPGGKATHLAARLCGSGVLIANDVHPTRARELAGNLERIGARNAIVTNESPERLADRLGAHFDRVLLDAPCSGESMFHKSEAARQDWSPAAVEGCARRQPELLATAAELVRRGGLLVYSTCTFGPEENEGVVARFLDTNPEFELIPLRDVPGASPGRPEWIPDGASRQELRAALRLWPHRVIGAGHFVVAFRRREGEVSHAAARPLPRIPAEVQRAVESFQRDYLTGEIGAAGFRMLGSELYTHIAGAPDLRGLRVVRPGWWLGTVTKGRFEPAHALAMGLSAEDARDPICLGPDEPAIHAYLRGETIPSGGRPGWVLVTLDGYPLGWGKRVGGTTKNHYPKGLRWR